MFVFIDLNKCKRIWRHKRDLSRKRHKPLEVGPSGGAKSGGEKVMSNCRSHSDKIEDQYRWRNNQLLLTSSYDLPVSGQLSGPHRDISRNNTSLLLVDC